MRQHFSDDTQIGTAADGGRGSDHTNALRAGSAAGRQRRRFDNAGEGNLQIGNHLVGHNRGDGTASGNDHFYVVALQKTDVFHCKPAQGLRAARAVRYAAGIAKIDQIFLR